MRRSAPLMMLVLAVCLGCAQPAEVPDGQRPPIEPVATRCPPVAMAGPSRTRRIVPIDDGRLAFVGHTLDPNGDRLGHILIADPAGGQPPEWIDLGVEYRAFAWARGSFLIAFWDSLLQVPLTGAAERVSNDTTLFKLTSPEVLVQGDGGVIVGGEAFVPPGRASSVVRMGPDSEVRWRTDYALVEGGELVEMAPISIAQAVTGDVVVAVNASWSTPEGLDPISFIVRLRPDTGEVAAVRAQDDDELGLRRVITDAAGRPYVLAVADQRGRDQRTGKPLIARVADDGSLFDAVRVPLPEGTAHGALTAAVETDDGWVLGGTACDDDEDWCAAWIVRVADGEVSWSQTVHRDLAATVSDITLVGQRIVATLASGAACCRPVWFDANGWLWELELDGACPTSRLFPTDGETFL